MKPPRTPGAIFKNLPEYPFEPNYLEIDGIRIHYVDEGSKKYRLFKRNNSFSYRKPAIFFNKFYY